MHLSEYVRIALFALRANKVRSFLTMLGVIIGVSSVILLVSIGSGLQAFVTETFTSLGSNVVFVLPGKVNISSPSSGRPSSPTSKFELSDVQDLRRAGGPILDAAPVTQLSATLTYRNASVTLPVIGLTDTLFSIRNLTIDKGKLLTKNDIERNRKAVVLGPKTAENLFGKHLNPVGKALLLNNSRYVVVGVLKAKGGGGSLGADIDDQAYIPITTSFRQFDISKPTFLLIEARDQESVSDVARLTKRVLLRRLEADDFTVVEQTELLSTVTQFLGVITFALGGIASISLLVGGIGIMNIMLVSVTERTREIGLRKSVGATSRAILIQFLIEAVILSLIGGGIGIALGFLGSLLLRRFIQTAVSAWSLLLAFGFSAGVGIVFGVTPAVRASRLHPIDALRYE